MVCGRIILRLEVGSAYLIQQKKSTLPGKLYRTDSTDILIYCNGIKKNK